MEDIIFFFFKQKTAYEIPLRLVGSEMCIRDRYTDDINEPKNTIYGAIGLSKKAHAIIKNIDLTEVKKSEGVITVVTQIDIPGRNDVGPVFDGDPIFPKKKVEFFGQPLFAVAATTTELARKAVLKAKITYKDLKPVITIKEALNKKQFLFKPRKAVSYTHLTLPTICSV